MVQKSTTALVIATLIASVPVYLGAQEAPTATPAGGVATAAVQTAPTPDANAKQAEGAEAGEDNEAAAAAQRQPFDSIMFTTDEFNEIQGRIASGEVKDTEMGRQAIEDASLYLSTIVYFGPKDWTIWVNGVPIGPNQEFQSFQVTDIDADSVQLLVPLSAQGMRPVRLAPNQSFITKSGMVVEGRVVQ